MRRERGYRAAAHEALYGGTMFGGDAVKDLLRFTGWGLLSYHAGLAHWITRVDQQLGPGQRILNIHGTGFHTACGLTFEVDILHEAGDWRRCLRCKHAIERQARERARLASGARRRQRPITESFRTGGATDGTHPTT